MTTKRQIGDDSMVIAISCVGSCSSDIDCEENSKSWLNGCIYLGMFLLVNIGHAHLHIILELGIQHVDLFQDQVIREVHVNEIYSLKVPLYLHKHLSIFFLSQLNVTRALQLQTK